MTTAKDLAQTLVSDLHRHLAVMTPAEEGDDFVPVVAVCYWEQPQTGLGLVGLISLTEDYMLMDETPEFLAGSGALMAQLRKLAFDGNDNNPYELLSEVTRMPEAELAPFVELVLSASIE